MTARADDDEPDLIAEPGPGALGAVSTLSGRPDKPPPKQAWPIGFHVAAPGPSHDDGTIAQAPARRRPRSSRKTP